MKRFLIATTALTLLIAPMGAAFAQPDRHDDHRGGPSMQGPAMQGPAMQGPAMRGPGMMGPAQHNWQRGQRIDRGNWNRYERVDYRRYKLRQPPRGYEWRRVDNNYVLAAVATGLIASVIAASR
jgi:Ni/Co efflux regulator RcnB